MKSLSKIVVLIIVSSTIATQYTVKFPVKNNIVQTLGVDRFRFGLLLGE